MGRSKSGLFLMELIIVTAFFAVASVICIQLFAMSHSLSTRSIGMQMAVVNAQSAAEIIEKGYADFVDVCRGILVDPDLVRKAKKGEPSNRCFDCKPVCKWFKDRTQCPGWIKLDPGIRLSL